MNKWLESENVSEELKILISSYNETELNIALNNKVEFGTAGLRGTMGAGFGYINENIINWATIGYAKYLKKHFNNPKVVIAYDNRKNSKEFAQICANVLSINSIEVYIFDILKSTPQLSFTIRMLNAQGGINITASHNPKADNGYKLYNEHGGQYLPDAVNEIKKYIEEIKSPIDVSVYTKANEDYITVLNDDSEYINFVKSNTFAKFEKYEKILVSSLHGCGSILKKMNDTIGFENISYVEEQLIADVNFSTAPEPNPDSIKAYEFSIENNKDCNYIITNDPDADRVGLYDVINKKLFTGNQLATLIVNYLIETNQYSDNQVLITSNVSSTLPLEIAKANGINTDIVLTGFKWIGKIMNDSTFFMGYEESNGYLTHTSTRDKDGISAAFKLIELINYYYNKGLTLNEVLESIYNKYGYYVEKQESLFLDDMSVVDKVINSIDLNTFDNIKYIEDFNTATRTFADKTEQITLPTNNMIKVVYNNNKWFAIRPSGTEPKIKVYLYANDKNYENSIKELNKMKDEVINLFK